MRQTLLSRTHASWEACELQPCVVREIRPKPFLLNLVLLLILSGLSGFQFACAGSPKAQTPVPSGQPTFSHVVLLVEENHSYSEVIANPSMPYFNGLASRYGLATQYFAVAHPSLPNYFALTTGLPETSDDNFSGTITDDNIVRELVKAGRTWRAYLESIPSAGYLGGDFGPYLRHHNPFSYFSDVQQDSAQAANIVPFSQFSSDVANNALPQYSFVAPDVNDDAHDGSLADADAWLKNNIAPLLASSSFLSNGLLIITFDEGAQSDVEHAGGHVATLIISPQSKSGYQSQTLYQHPSVLRLSLEALGVNHFPGTAATAADMIEFFQGH